MPQKVRYKIFIAISAAVQVLCLVLVAAVIYFCKKSAAETVDPLRLADLAMASTVWILFLSPISLIFNILATSDRKRLGLPHSTYLLWTVLSAMLSFILFITAAIVFVSTTGGV